jgi:uncharacterized protein (TIGR00266 family)
MSSTQPIPATPTPPAPPPPPQNFPPQTDPYGQGGQYGYQQPGGYPPPNQPGRGLMGALKRAVGGESAFVSTFTARGGPGEVTFAPGMPGDIAALELNNQMFLVQSSSYMAGDVSFSGEGLFVLQVHGTGLLLVSSFGAIHRKRLAPGERYVVDTGHLVAWEGHMQYQLRKAAAGFFRSMVSGEGIVSEFLGPGELLIQTRNLAAFAGVLKPFFPSQSGGGGGGFNVNFGS